LTTKEIEYTVRDFNPFDPRHLKMQDKKGKKVIVEKPASSDWESFETSEVSSAASTEEHTTEEQPSSFFGKRGLGGNSGPLGGLK